MAYSQGAIVIADDAFGNNPKRPYLILSNDHVPFHGQEYVAAVITTTARTGTTPPDILRVSVVSSRAQRLDDHETTRRSE
jgi:mRNA-degrading endonuclease toxin of MazEF toxin-antitoxin module